MTRVLLVDDQAVVRAGFRVMLELARDLTVVGEAADGAAALAVARATVPDVVLMDVRMPAMDGVAATRALRREPALSSCRVIVLTTFDDDEYVFGALAAGASGFLLKDVGADELRAAVRTVAAGGSLLSPAVTGRVIEALVTRRDPVPVRPERLDVLTAR